MEPELTEYDFVHLVYLIALLILLFTFKGPKKNKEIKKNPLKI